LPTTRRQGAQPRTCEQFGFSRLPARCARLPGAPGVETAEWLKQVHTSPQILAQRDQRIAASSNLELSRQLPKVDAALQQIAARLALSLRTLQRRLREAGLSFSQLVVQTRQKRVLHYLREPALELELAEIAFLVGFSEPGLLSRAFRRWTAPSPGEYRRQLKEH
jgi:AraC-like DNA-binding protein